MSKFIVLSLILHLAGAYLNHISPEKKFEPTEKKQPLKVKFVPLEIEKTDPTAFQKGLRSNNSESFETDKLLSKSNRRVYSSQKKKMRSVENFKTMIPKQSKKPTIAKKVTLSKLNSAKKLIRKKIKRKPSKIKPAIMNHTKKEKISIKKQEKSKEMSSARSPIQPIGAVAMLNRLDIDKYTTLDTTRIEEGDDEPISLNTKEARYSNYFSKIKFQIEQVWIYPLEAARRGISGQITLKFKLSREGNLLGIRLINSSGKRTLDEAALKAVKKASPYYPFPPNINKEKITILATFVYSPTYKNIYSYQ